MTSTLTAPAPSLSRPTWRRSWIRTAVTLPETRWAAAATALFALGGISQLGGAPAPVWWALYLACYATGGWEPALAGVRALRERSLDVDLLMIVAALLAVSIGQVFDGALLIVIFATSGALESFVTRRTAESVRALLDLAPEQATRLTSDGSEQIVHTDELAVGDVVLVRPGERIGADGTVTDGRSEVDQASITGEPLPAFKEPGRQVFAGTYNGTGALRVRVDRPTAESVVARIVALVEEASATKARTQLFIDKVEQRYSVGVVAATLALFLVPLTLGAELQPTLLRAMTFMIVASPCAVVLATMPPLLSAIANAGRHGVLVKSAVALETFRLVDQVVIDKTGTLTEGTPRVTRVEPLPGSGYDADRLLAMAAAVERPGEHPIARAVVAAAHERGLIVPDVDEFRSRPGQGVDGRVANHDVRVGSPAMLADGVDPELRSRVDDIEAGGGTAVVVAIDGIPVGVLALADRLRPDAGAAVAALAELTGRPVILLTGDNPRAAAQVASEVGIADVHAGLLPADKVARIRTLQAAGRCVLAVGDGVNDAPALAAADLGVAMGRQGSDLTLQTADAVLVRDELATLPPAMALARQAYGVVKANLAFAATVIATLVLVDLVWILPLPLGVAGHEGSTVVVGLNGLRLLRASAWRPGDQTTRRRRSAAIKSD